MNIKSLLKPGIGQMGTHLPRPISLSQTKCLSLPEEDKLPTLSIVIPSLNQAQYLELTLQSILSQCYPKLELIVVDGASTDASIDVIRRYESHLKWWVSETDLGQTQAINKGFARSTGGIMAWINSDDLVAPGAFARVVNYFLESSNANVVYGNRILIDEAGLEIGRWILPRHSDRVLKWADFVPQETMYWRRCVWDSLGGQLDESFNFAMDWDFLLRCSKKTSAIHHIPYILGLFRVHSQQKTVREIKLVGSGEMQRIRIRELGKLPTRWQLLLALAPYLVAARLHELAESLRSDSTI